MLSVYSYKDPVLYIQDFIAFQRTSDSSFSMRKWASEIGFNSPASLIEILKGNKSLRPAVVKSIIGKIGLDKSEYSYFLSMVARSKATTDLEEILYDLFINELSPTSNSTYKTKRFTDGDFFSHWIFTTILALAGLKNFKMSTENIQASLRESVPLEIIQAAFDLIIEKGLMTLNENGTADLKYDRISTENDRKHESVKDYFIQVADLSKNAIDLSLDKREFQSFSLPLNKNQIPLAKEIIRKCRNNLTSLCSQDSDVVYQMNMALFPLSVEDYEQRN